MLKNVEIKKLSLEMVNDYLDLFENRGLIKGDINHGCYCVWHHWTDLHEYERNKLPLGEQSSVKRNYAINLIQDGKLNGFTAYLDKKMIGFCNADIKNNYYRLDQINNPESWLALNEDNKVLSIVCYVIDINFRGQGIASALLDYVCDYATNNNIDYVEAYPSYGEFNVSNCCGPFSMYHKKGFLLIHNEESETVVRKRIS